MTVTSPAAHVSQTPHPNFDQQSPHRSESLIDLKDLALKEFKIHGVQTGDSTADISYSNICKHIAEGLKEKHTKGEIIRVVLHTIKPGNFKDMLISKNQMTVTELVSL